MMQESMMNSHWRARARTLVPAVRIAILTCLCTPLVALEVPDPPSSTILDPTGVDDPPAVILSPHNIDGTGLSPQDSKVGRIQGRAARFTPLGDVAGDWAVERTDASVDGYIPTYAHDGEPFVRVDGFDGEHHLQTVLAADYGLSLPGWELTQPTAVSEDGTIIVGTGINPDGVVQMWVIELAPIPGDVDIDGDVDLSDFDELCECVATGNTRGAPFGCETFDFDRDGDVDLADFAEFQVYFTGSK